MNTKQIDYALELAQVKNFNRAAENLFISSLLFRTRSRRWRMRSVLLFSFAQAAVRR